MDIIISPEKVDVQDCDVLVTGLFEDERPLRGASGWIDWRLNGMLSHLLIEDKLTGNWKEKTLIPSHGRITPKLILLFGLGKAQDYSYLHVREVFPFFLETLKNLKAPTLCLSLPYGEEYNVDCGKLAEVLIEGLADCLDQYPADRQWMESLRLFFAEGVERFSEILLGVKTARSILEDRLKIRIFIPSEETSETNPVRVAF
ncbi:MAG: M17 family peptidase N-terminal domain-containing protein [Thermodesulfobacteriota bacterium]|nr:M17 family peptidase N-terminal domain-containing protein [Thermodesulfobacteriota bacterium]